MESIATFPRFTTITRSNVSLIKSATSMLQDHSDFNHLSLVSYNYHGENKMSMLNENIVIKFIDYVDKTPFLSLVGTNKIEETLATLFNYSEMNGGIAIKLLLAEVKSILGENENYVFTEDEDNFDYVLSVDNILELKGKDHKNKARAISKFRQLYPNAIFNLSIDINETLTKNIKDTLDKWVELNKEKTSLFEIEINALLNFLTQHHTFNNILITTCYIEETMVGFSISEIIEKKYAMNHFMKTDISFSGSFDALDWYTAKKLKETGVEKINIQQDLGLPGLRYKKKKSMPIKMFKKYQVSPKKK